MVPEFWRQPLYSRHELKIQGDERGAYSGQSHGAKSSQGSAASGLEKRVTTDIS